MLKQLSLINRSNEDLRFRRLGLRDIDEVITESADGSLAGEAVFRFRKDAIDLAVCDRTFNAFWNVGNSSNSSHRKAVKGRGGKEAVWGWLEGQARFGEKGPRMTETTRRNLDRFMAALPFFWQMDAIYRECWPDRYAAQQAFAARASRAVPKTCFTTITSNSSVPTLAHRDGGNMPNVAGCLAALGDFEAGYFCLPAYRVAFDIQPGDVLILDMQKEFHGNIEPIVGDRLAIISYFRQGLLQQKID